MLKTDISWMVRLSMSSAVNLLQDSMFNVQPTGREASR